ncbi:MAG: Sec-independent protein translocase protein TatB [Alphaproteobacteria bacterium]|nr:Sec-independent protein translocase protein TatB [Alphaproteobacteria bacterium]
MLDIGWPELAVIGAVALVVIGPKDLPKVMYAMGRWVGKARRFAQDIHRTFEQIAFEAEMGEKREEDKPDRPSDSVLEREAGDSRNQE